MRRTIIVLVVKWGKIKMKEGLNTQTQMDIFVNTNYR